MKSGGGLGRPDKHNELIRKGLLTATDFHEVLPFLVMQRVIFLKNDIKSHDPLFWIAFWNINSVKGLLYFQN